MALLRIKQIFKNTSNIISHGIEKIFHRNKLNDSSFEELEELLISADVGVSMSLKLIDQLKSKQFHKEVTAQEVKVALVDVVCSLLSTHQANSITIQEGKLNIIFITGVNGSGKTTTVGKLAAMYTSLNKKVAIAACDTFKPAAIEQLELCVSISNPLFVKGEINSDPASVAYRSVERAMKYKADVLIIDTAGRLQNQQNLMDELAKMVRVIKKLDNSFPFYSLLTLDSTTGQNAYQQVEKFNLVTGISGLILTKLDGTAKAGVILQITEKFQLPIYFITFGENLLDLDSFNPMKFSKELVGI